MSKFKCPCGLEFTEENNTEKFSSNVLMSRVYKDEKQAAKNYVNATCLACKIEGRRTIERPRSLMDMTTFNDASATDLMCIATNKEWKERETVKDYGDQCMNTKRTQTIEVIFQTDDYRKTVYSTFTGNCSMYDLIENVVEDVWNAPSEADNSLSLPAFYFTNEDGECVNIELERESELFNMIISARVVEFKNEILSAEEEEKQMEKLFGRTVKVQDANSDEVISSDADYDFDDIDDDDDEN
ncbi:MAG: hypothetical protein K0R00_107 [Herbinix sp.]|nr:hypothetical protein [Herbinix sp.]